MPQSDRDLSMGIPSSVTVHCRPFNWEDRLSIRQSVNDRSMRPAPAQRRRDRVFDWQCNSGGPRSRTRSQELKATVLGTDSGHIRCPRVVSAALVFGDVHPVVAIEQLCARLSIRGAEEARRFVEVPASRCIVRLNQDAPELNVSAADPYEVLRAAVILGLSTATFFDPARPVIWTGTSLLRRVELFEGGGIYA